jgi:hypothetical protein
MDSRFTTGTRGILGLLLALTLIACNGASGTKDSTPAPVTQGAPPPVTRGPPPPVPPGQTAAPQITGTPPTTAVAGHPYSFQPQATDADHDPLSFAVSGKPGWASFDAATGRLWGTPQAADLGSHDQIVIRVSDGTHTQALPQYTLTVIQGIKSNYGHYFATQYADTPADAAMLCEQPGVSGVNWRQTWQQVEPTAGVYDFSSFDKVLAAIAASHNPGCQLWLFVEFKSFAASPIKNPCPTYLQAQHSALNTYGNGAATCFMWEPIVVSAYTSMMKAAAAHFDSNPRVEGLIIEESSLGLDGAYSQDVADGGTYTPVAWRDALIGIIDQCAAAFATSRCMPFLNFLRGGQSYLFDVSAAISAIPDNQVCFSGPDLLPNSPSLYDSPDKVYEVLTQHTGCRSNSAQNNSYQVPGCSMDCIFHFAVSGTLGTFPASAPLTGGLCVNSYIFWNDKTSKSATGLTYKDALPVITANPYGPDWLKQCVGTDGEPLT